MSRVVYFLAARDGGPIRIGCSTDVERRISSYSATSSEPLSILATIPGYKVREAILHMVLAADRVHYDWFRPTARLWKLIIEAQETGDIATIPQEPDVVMRVRDDLATLDDMGLDLRAVSEVAQIQLPTFDYYLSSDRRSPATLTALRLALSSGLTVIPDGWRFRDRRNAA